MPAFPTQNHDPKKRLNMDERLMEALRIRQRWEELGQQLKAFPQRRLTEEEVERNLVINGELQKLLPQLPAWWA
jgi:hypothetical protein